MSRALKVTGWRVEVTPRQNMWSRTVEDRIAGQLDDCKAIAKQIKRHVDLDGTVDVTSESVAVCSHCGGEWTESADSPHNGGCCDEDAKSMPDDDATAAVQS